MKGPPPSLDGLVRERSSTPPRRDDQPSLPDVRRLHVHGNGSITQGQGAGKKTPPVLQSPPVAAAAGAAPAATSAGTVVPAQKETVTLRVTPIMSWAQQLGWRDLDEDELKQTWVRMDELVEMSTKIRDDAESQIDALEQEQHKCWELIKAGNGPTEEEAMQNLEERKYASSQMRDAAQIVWLNPGLITHARKEMEQDLASVKEQMEGLRINMPIDIEASPTYTIKMLKNQLNAYFINKPYKEDAMPDMMMLWLDLDGTREKLGSRTTVHDMLKKCGDQTPIIHLSMEVDPGCLGMGSGTCTEWFFLMGCTCLSLVFCGLLAVTAAFIFQPGVRQNDMQSWEHFVFVGSFFGVLATCSAVFCIWFLLPRYTEKRGPRGAIGDRRQVQSLEQETWVWSFEINGQGAKLKILFGFGLAWVKFQQLFSLTYQREIIALSAMPKVVIALGDYVLFDLEKVIQEKNSTFSYRLPGLDLGSNYSSPLDDFADLSSEDRYYIKTVLFLVVCGAMVLIIVATKAGGCLEGRGSETAQTITVGIVGLISSFFTIPLYRHLLTALDCTYRPTGMGANGTTSGFEWDAASDVFGDLAGAAKRECYGAWWAVNMDVEEENERGETDWTAFNFMIFGMVGLCMFQWPITLYLMVRPDSERDDEQAGLLIADAVIRAQQLSGRTVRMEDEIGRSETEPCCGARTPKFSGQRFTGGVGSHAHFYERQKRCCKDRQRKNPFGLVGYSKGTEAFAELEKMYSLSVSQSDIEDKYRLHGKVVEGQVKVTETVEYDLEGQLWTRVAVEPKSAKKKKLRASAGGSFEFNEARVTAVPLMNRLALRDYAQNIEFQESEEFRKHGAHKRYMKPRSEEPTGWDLHDEVFVIDHRKCCGTRDLDSATLGVSGPKRRPREAAVNFGLEIAIVVVSVLFSGRAEIMGGQLQLGENCLDPLRGNPELRSTSSGSARYALPLFVDFRSTVSAAEYYQDWCNDYNLQDQAKCESPLGWFPPEVADGDGVTWLYGHQCSSTPDLSLGAWADDASWVAVLHRWSEACRNYPDDDSQECIAASRELYGPSWNPQLPSMEANAMRRAACGNYCKDKALENGLKPQIGRVCCQLKVNGQWEPGQGDPAAECEVLTAISAPNEMIRDPNGVYESMIYNVTSESLKHGWRCEWGPRKLTIMEAKLFALAVMHFIMALYFCNPVTLLGGEVKCSPYRNKAQTDSRTGVLSLGYPYNFEPLNFVRGAMSMVCSSFAAFQILAWRRIFPDESTAVLDWGFAAIGCVAIYLGCMLVRWQVFRGHLKSSQKVQASESPAAEP